MNGLLSLPPLAARDYALAALLTLAWTLAIAALSADALAVYYPIADEWALLAHADAALASPASWFTTGFSDYFTAYPELSGPYANFVRPGFNLTYFLLRLVLAPESAGWLWFNYFAIGLCSGLVYLSVAHTRHWLALPVAALLPLMQSYLPASAQLVPCFAFDPLVAALCLAALLMFQRGRPGWSAALLLYAVMCKETALPVAVALPLVQLLSRRSPQATAQPRPWSTFALLCLPLAAWIVLRLSAFGEISGGTYAFAFSGPRQLAHAIAGEALRWPFWTEPLSRPVMIVNALVVAALSLRFVFSLWRREPLDAVLLAFLGSQLFMLLVGGTRYAAVLQALLLVCLLRWVAQPSRLALAVSAPVLAVAGFIAAGAWPLATDLRLQMPQYMGIARQYVETLRKFPADARVIVVNDPVSWLSRAHWLREVAQIPAQVYKVTDYTCPGKGQRLRQPCEVSLLGTEDPRVFEFTQSCGFDLCGAIGSGLVPADLKLEGGIGLKVKPTPVAPEIAGGLPNYWVRAELRVPEGPSTLLWFDPGTRAFHSLDLR